MLRKTYVLRECEIEPSKLKKGDVFRVEPINKADYLVDKNEWYYLDKPFKKTSEGNLNTECKVLIPPHMGKTLNFK